MKIQGIQGKGVEGQKHDPEAQRGSKNKVRPEGMGTKDLEEHHGT